MNRQYTSQSEWYQSDDDNIRESASAAEAAQNQENVEEVNLVPSTAKPQQLTTNKRVTVIQNDKSNGLTNELSNTPIDSDSNLQEIIRQKRVQDSKQQSEQDNNNLNTKDLDQQTQSPSNYQNLRQSSQGQQQLQSQDSQTSDGSLLLEDLSHLHNKVIWQALVNPLTARFEDGYLESEYQFHFFYNTSTFIRARRSLAIFLFVFFLGHTLFLYLVPHVNPALDLHLTVLIYKLVVLLTGLACLRLLDAEIQDERRRKRQEAEQILNEQMNLMMQQQNQEIQNASGDDDDMNDPENMSEQQLQLHEDSQISRQIEESEYNDIQLQQLASDETQSPRLSQLLRQNLAQNKGIMTKLNDDDDLMDQIITNSTAEQKTQQNKQGLVGPLTQQSLSVQFESGSYVRDSNDSQMTVNGGPHHGQLNPRTKKLKFFDMSKLKSLPSLRSMPSTESDSKLRQQTSKSSDIDRFQQEVPEATQDLWINFNNLHNSNSIRSESQLSEDTVSNINNFRETTTSRTTQSYQQQNSTVNKRQIDSQADSDVIRSKNTIIDKNIDSNIQDSWEFEEGATVVVPPRPTNPNRQNEGQHQESNELQPSESGQVQSDTNPLQDIMDLDQNQFDSSDVNLNFESAAASQQDNLGDINEIDQLQQSESQQPQDPTVGFAINRLASDTSSWMESVASPSSNYKANLTMTVLNEDNISHFLDDIEANTNNLNYQQGNQQYQVGGGALDYPMHHIRITTVSSGEKMHNNMNQQQTLSAATSIESQQGPYQGQSSNTKNQNLMQKNLSILTGTAQLNKFKFNPVSPFSTNPSPYNNSNTYSSTNNQTQQLNSTTSRVTRPTQNFIPSPNQVMTPGFGLMSSQTSPNPNDQHAKRITPGFGVQMMTSGSSQNQQTPDRLKSMRLGTGSKQLAAMRKTVTGTSGTQSSVVQDQGSYSNSTKSNYIKRNLSADKIMINNSISNRISRGAQSLGLSGKIQRNSGGLATGQVQQQQQNYQSPSISARNQQTVQYQSNSQSFNNFLKDLYQGAVARTYSSDSLTQTQSQSQPQNQIQRHGSSDGTVSNSVTSTQSQTMNSVGKINSKGTTTSSSQSLSKTISHTLQHYGLSSTLLEQLTKQNTLDNSCGGTQTGAIPQQTIYMAQNVTAGPAKNHGKHHHHHHRGHQSHIKPHGCPDQDQQHRHHHRHGQQSQHHQHHHGHGHRHQHGHHHTKGINESTSVRDQRNQTSFDSNPDNVMKFNKHTKGQQGPGQDQTYEQLLTPGIGQQEQKQADSSKLNQNDSHLARVDIQNDFNFVDGIDPRATDWQSSNQTLDSDSGQLLLQNDEDDLQNLNENDQNDDLDNSDQQNDESQQNNNQSSPNESTEFQSSYYWIAKRGRILVFVQFYLVIATTAAMLEPTFLTKDRSQQWVTTASGCFILLWLSQASIGSYYPYFLGLVNFNIFLIISLFLIVFAPGLKPPEEYQDEFIPYYKPGLVPIFYKMELFSICVFFMVSAIFAGYKGDQRSRLTFFKSYSMEQMELRTDLLLKEMLPTSILEEVKQKALALNPHDNTGVMQSYQRTKIARYYRDKVILFSDISGFTAYSKTVSAYQVVSLVTSLFSRIDDLSREVGVYKVCTIGDCYVAIPEPDEDQDASNMDGNTNLQLNNQININTKAIVLSAVKMLHFSSRLLTTIQSTSRDLQVPFDMRIGLHIGNFVGGVIGTTKLRYDIWGKDVSIANLMESNGIAGKINVSRPLKSFLKRYLPGAFVYKKHKEVIIQSGLPGKKKSMIEPGGLSNNSLDQVALNQDLINQMNNTNATVDQTNISKNDMIRSKESQPFQEQSESEANSNLTGSTRLQRQHKRTDTNSNLLSVNTGDLRQTNQVDISPFQSSFNKSQSESDIPSGGQSHSDQGKTQQTKSPSIRDATSVESMWMNGSTNANNDQMKFNQQQYQQNYTNVGDSLNFDDFYNMRQSQTLNEQDRLLALTNSNKKLRKIISKEQQESKSDSFEVTQVPTNVDYDQTEVPVPNGSVTPDLNNLSISSVIKNAHFVNSTPLNSVPLQEHRHPDKQFKASHTSAVQKREFLEERRLRETMQEIEYSKRLTLNESDSDNDGKILDMTKFKNETSNLRNSNRDSGNLKLDLKDSSQGRWSNSKTQPSQAQQTSQSLNLSDLAIKELDLNQIIMVNDAEEEQQILQKDNEEGNIDADEVNEDNLNVQSDSESKTQTINKSQNLRLSLEKTDSIMDIPTVLGVSPTGTRSSALNVTKIKKANLEERSSYSQADFQSMSSNQQNLKIKEAHLTMSSTAVTYNQDSVSAQTLLTQQQFNDTPEFGVRTKNKFQSFDESLTEGSKSPEAKRSPEAITSANSTIIKLPNAPRSQIQIQNQAKQVNDTNINDNNVPAQTEISESQTVTIDPQDLNPLQAFMNSYKGPQLLASQVTSGQSESVPVPQEPDEQDIPWIDQLINDPEHGLEQCLKKQMRERFLLKSSQSGPSRLSESDANSTDLNLSLKNNTISFKDFSEAIALRNKSYNNIDPDGNASDNQQLSLRQIYGPGQKQKQYAQSPEFKKSVMEFFALRERETNKNSSRKKSELSPLSLSLKVNNNREGQHRSTINDIVINNDSNTNNNKTLRPPPQTVQHTMTYDLKERKEITMKSYIIEPTEIWLKIIEEIERRSGTGRRN